MSVIDDYLKNVAEPQKAALERVRRIIRQSAPEAEEVITYGIPGFKYKGKYLISFAAFKNHMSIFPGSTMSEKTKGKLDGYKIAKGTVQFTEAKPLPESIIKEIVRDRLSHIG